MMGLITFLNGGGNEENQPGDKYERAKEDETSLGNVLLDLGYVTQEALEEAIKIQKSQSLLGRILVEMGPRRGGITEEQLKDALLEQKVRRRKARAAEVIKSNSKRHQRLVGEVQEHLSSLNKKYFTASKG
jgi:hypothetical protein